MTDNKYTNGKIYKITDTAYSECYIGSTVQTLSQRIAGHRSKHKQFLNNKKVSFVRVYKLFDNYGLENCKIELLELCPCNSLIELKRREGYYIRTLECVNKYIAGRTKLEYEHENKEKISERKQQHYNEHKDNISEHRRQHYNENKDTIRQHRKQQYNENDKIAERTKQYEIENKDKIAERKKQYEFENKDKIAERRKQYKSENKDKLKEQRHQQYMKTKITQLNINNTSQNAINNLSHTENQQDDTNSNNLNLV
jgi:hypothetical protein